MEKYTLLNLDVAPLNLSPRDVYQTRTDLKLEHFHVLFSPVYPEPKQNFSSGPHSGQ